MGGSLLWLLWVHFRCVPSYTNEVYALCLGLCGYLGGWRWVRGLHGNTCRAACHGHLRARFQSEGQNSMCGPQVHRFCSFHALGDWSVHE
jgi:hypothetical protein